MKDFYNICEDLQAILLDIIDLDESHLWEFIYKRHDLKSLREEVVQKIEDIKVNLDLFKKELMSVVRSGLSDMDLYEINSHLVMLSDFRPFYEQAYKAMRRFVSNSSENDMKEGIQILYDSKTQVNLCLSIARRDLKRNKKFTDLYENRLKVDWVFKFDLKPVE